MLPMWAKDHYSRDPQCPAKGRECSKCHKKDHFEKYVRRSESTVSTLVTLTLGTKMALLEEVQTGTPTSMRLGSASTQ